MSFSAGSDGGVLTSAVGGIKAVGGDFLKSNASGLAQIVNQGSLIVDKGAKIVQDGISKIASGLNRTISPAKKWLIDGVDGVQIQMKAGGGQIQAFQDVIPAQFDAIPQNSQIQSQKGTGGISATFESRADGTGGDAFGAGSNVGERRMGGTLRDLTGPTEAINKRVQAAVNSAGQFVANRFKCATRIMAAFGNAIQNFAIDLKDLTDGVASRAEINNIINYFIRLVKFQTKDNPDAGNSSISGLEELRVNLLQQLQEGKLTKAQAQELFARFISNNMVAEGARIGTTTTGTAFEASTASASDARTSGTGSFSLGTFPSGFAIDF